MLVTFTNTTADPIFLNFAYRELTPSGTARDSLTVSKTLSELDQAQDLKVLVENGDVALTFALEAGDSASVGAQETYPAFSNTTRPAAAAWPLFSPIWNTDDNAPNFSDGTDWRDAAGVIT